MTKKPKTNKRAEKVDAAIAATVAPIVAAIEAGIADPTAWRAPWHDVDPMTLLPYCPSTDYAYTSGNRLALGLYSACTGAPHHWGTFNQWRDMSKHSTECNATAKENERGWTERPDCGAACHVVSVRKGETSHMSIIRPAMAKTTNEQTGEEGSKIVGWCAYPVFHAGQVEGYTMPTAERAPGAPEHERADIDRAYTWAAGIGARVIESPNAGASYSPQLDRVQMPDRDRFTSAHGCWSTMAHELTHWTGHESRLARTYGKRFGDDAYAAEELVAELGAAFTLAAIGRSSEPREDHAQYLAAWLRVLKADPSRLWTAAKHAETASAYLIERATIGAELVTA